MEKIFVVKGVHSSEDGPSSASVDGLFTEEQANECFRLHREQDKLWNEMHAKDQYGWFSSRYEIVELSVETGVQAIEQARAALAKVKQEKEEANKIEAANATKPLGKLADFFPKIQT